MMKRGGLGFWARVGFLFTELIFFGCSRNATNSLDEGDISFVDKPLPAAAQAIPVDPVAQSQADIGLSAVKEGNRLRVGIENRTKKDLVCGPKNFAIALPGGKDLIRFKDPDTLFPPVRLKPGEHRVGLLSLRDVTSDLDKARLIFNHPDCRPAKAPIEFGEAMGTAQKP